MGYIKLYRKMLSQEWYRNSDTTRVFVHLLLTASDKDDVWKGVEVTRGSRAASIETLSTELKMSPSQIRVALYKLTETSEVLDIRYPTFSVLSIVRWDEYHAEER